MLQFEENSHTYRWNGSRIPHVTGVLKDLVDYSMVKPDALERARQEGVEIHRMVELDAKGELSELPEWIVPRYEAWLLFKKETRFEIVASERKVYHPIYGYAGTLDLEGRIHGTTPAIIDVKRSLMAGDVIGLQTAAYAEARNAELPKAERIQFRGALRLQPNGKYKLEPYQDRNDFNVFLACLTRFVWKGKHQ